VAGVPMAMLKVWSFTTGVTTALPPGGSTLGVFGGSAGITNQGYLRINNGVLVQPPAATLVTGFHDVPKYRLHRYNFLMRACKWRNYSWYSCKSDYNTALALYSISQA
jgi:hypothetical protein